MDTIVDNFANKTNQEFRGLKNTQLYGVASQILPHRSLQLRNSGTTAEQFPGKQTVNRPVPFFNSSANCQTEIQKTDKHLKTTLKGGNNLPPVKIRTPHIEERLVRDEQTNELYLPLFSTVVLKRKKMLCGPLYFKNGPTIDALVDSKAYVSAVSQKNLNKIKHQTQPISSNTTTLTISD